MKKVLPILCLLALFGLSNGIVQAGITSKANLSSAGLISQKGSPTTFAVQGTHVMIGGTIVNQSTETITNITIFYSDGTNTFSDNQSVSISAGETYHYTHSTPYTMPSVGDYQITSWAQLNGDPNQETNHFVTHAKSILFTPLKKVTFEEEAGMWCEWCPRGFVWMDSMYNANPNTTELIAVHDDQGSIANDPLTVAIYDAGATNPTYYPAWGTTAGFPSIEPDRLVVDDPSNIFPDYADLIGLYGLADINVTSTMNGNVATIVANTHFASAVGSGYKLACVITEDQVHSTSYFQNNVYSGEPNSGNYVLPTVDGYNFHTLAGQVPGSALYFNFVARAILSGYEGSNGSLPSTINAGDTPSFTWTYTVPSGDVVANMKAIVLLINTNTTPAPSIMNANHTMFGLSSVPVISGILNSLNIYPNPFTNQANINFSLNQDENVTITVSDLLGQNVMTLGNGLMSAGSHNIMLNGTGLTSGMYFITLKAGDYSTTQKVLLNK